MKRDLKTGRHPTITAEFAQGRRCQQINVILDMVGERRSERRNLQTVDSMIDQTVKRTASVRALVVICTARMMATTMIIVAMPKTPTKPNFCLVVILTE